MKKTYLDWSGYDSYGMGDAYAGIPATGGAYAKAVAVCMNNKQCQRTGKGVMCPSFRVTGDPAHSTGARVNAFKAALNGELGEDPFLHPQLAEAMDLCVSCKGCKRECPSGVDMTLIKAEYLAQRRAAGGGKWRETLFARLPRWLGRGLPLRPFVQWRNRSPLLARLLERATGISAARALPEPAAEPFTAPASGSGERGEVILLVDTFCGQFEPGIAAAAHRVLTAAGYRVRQALPSADDSEPQRPLCCGRSYLAAGMVEQAQEEARRVLSALRPALAAGTPVVGLEPSCLLALRDEFLALGLGEEGLQLSKQAFLFEEFLARAHQKQPLPLRLRPLPQRALLHGHCHQKAFGAMKSVRKLLALIPELELELIEAGCCGMAGSFGFEAEHQAISLAMAEQELLPTIRAAPADTLILADGFSCRHQIAHGSGRRAIHVAELLAQALDTGTPALEPSAGS